ncbi:MAG: HU family DNA-binding protein [Smithellaceae bacterium]
MTKNELIKKAHDKFNAYSQKDIAYAVKIIFDSMIEAMKKEERVEIRGFGNFTIRERKARIGRNPKSGAHVTLSDRKVPFFKTGKDLRLKVDGKNGL